MGLECRQLEHRDEWADARYCSPLCIDAGLATAKPEYPEADFAGGMLECDLAIVTLGLEGGGPERDTVLLCNALAHKGVRIALLALRGKKPLQCLVDPAIQLIDIAQPRIRYAILGIRRAIRTLVPTVVVGSGIPSLNLAALAAVRSLPRVHRPTLILREAAVPSMARHDPSISNRVAYRILRHVYRYADHIITLTDGARRDLMREFSVPNSMISVMGTNAVLPPEIVDQVSHWDGDYDRESDLIVCVGRLSAEKDQRTLLRAMTLLPSHRRWRLAIVGNGPERAALEALARKNGLSHRVRFTGFVANPLAGWSGPAWRCAHRSTKVLATPSSRRLPVGRQSYAPIARMDRERS